MEDTSNKKVYELGYHILPTLSEDEVAKVVTALKGELSKMGAEVIAEAHPTMTTLAYELGKDIENKNRKFGTHCGVSVYNERLINELKNYVDIKVFAEYSDESTNDPDYVVRCWSWVLMYLFLS
jgi:ribosomal protein S6